jgi:hypothetical protein
MDWDDYIREEREREAHAYRVWQREQEDYAREEAYREWYATHSEEQTATSAPAPESVAANELEDVETGEAVENSLRSTGTSDWDGEDKEEIDG